MAEQQPNSKISRELRDICGNIGGVEALTTCSKCKSGVEHHYCLRNRSRPSRSVSSGVQLTKDAEPKNLYAENAVHTVEETFPTTCSPVASWMVTFILKDEKTSSVCLTCLPTSHALQKVKEFWEDMPKVLEFVLCPYEDFLRTVFKGCDPDVEDIGFYFFPDNMNRSDKYIFLLEQLSGQFFFKSCIDEVDLLVFSSKVLHKDYSELYKHDFLWGMFRHHHEKLRSAMEGMVVKDVEIDDDVDMEVDMVGGKIVGTVDVVIPKQKQSPDSNSNSAKLPRDFDLNVVPLEPTSDFNSAEVPRDFDLNHVPPEPTSNSNYVEVPRDSDMNDVPPGFSPSMRREWLKF